MNQEKKHPTVIVGGGVIGAFAAYYLRQQGREVAIVDRGLFGKGCSHANCGYVSPSHVVPLARPGQILYGLRGLFTTQQALRIQPKLSPSLWWWLLRFAARCNAHDMLASGVGIHALLQSSAALYREVLQREKLAVEFKTDGLLFVFREQDQFEHYREIDRWLKENFNVPAQAIEGSDALVAFEPALKTGLAGAWLYEIDAHLRPDRLMSELRRWLLENGVTLHEQSEVTGFTSHGSQATGVQTKNGLIEADEVILSTGAWTPLLEKHLGCSLPIQPGKGYSITMARPKLCPRYPMILEECHVAVTPFEQGYRLGSTMEFGGYDATLNRKRLNFLRAGAARYLLEPTAEPVMEEWFGWRPMTIDGNPYIDRTPRFKNVWVAAGHNMLGLSTATATGKLLSELMLGIDPHIDPKPYRIGR
jgi:D-amino-acid dehydrogenase